MKIFQILQQRFTLILTISIFLLQISACSSGNSLDGSANQSDIYNNDTNNNLETVNISLAWTAPAEREDNSPISLSEIAGYQVFFGVNKGQYSNSIAINDGSTTSHTFTNLPTGTYYFVVTTIDTEGRESQYSSEVVITT
ncbi:MAG: hypothetical protein COB77_06265 [Gammaproteobacteria bacterium]|nr:MAG: hypothetical protein COB77_06265 [Gammaproteobacteria bacterium]